MPTIPVHCAKCGKVFQEEVSVPSGTSGTFSVDAAQCPFCGATETIPEGSLLVLGSGKSVILPSFDASSILESNVSKIVLSLYVMGMKSESEKFQVTINPFDTATKEIRDGLSSFISPKMGEYVDFQLPRELFEKILGTNNGLLLKLLSNDQSIVLAGPEISGTEKDPKLLIVSNGASKKDEQAPAPTIVNNFHFENISDSQFHFGETGTARGGMPARWWENTFVQSVALLAGIITIVSLIAWAVDKY